MKPHGNNRWLTLLAVIPAAAGLTGCAGASPASTHQNAANSSAAATASTQNTTNTTTSTKDTANSTNKSSHPSNAMQQLGWRYISLMGNFGSQAQIAGIKVRNGNLELTISSQDTSKNAVSMHYNTTPVDLSTARTAETNSAAQKPQGYVGKWQLTFGPTQGHTAVKMKLTNGSVTIPIPASIPAYASEINPAPGNPASFDNRVLGQSGNWVWIAMKGPGKPPIPQLVWHYRRWNRILAVNVQTKEMTVFTIPAITSETDTWGTVPAFINTTNRVYIATGNWVGVLPANPSNAANPPVLSPEPSQFVAQDKQKMLQTLQNLETTAADGEAQFWNNYAMKGNEKYSGSSWIQDPAIWNHGDFPPSLYWALNFPLKSGTPAYQKREKLVSEIQQILKDPVFRASIAYSTPAQLKAAFHGKPPMSLPGYVIKNGYYVKKH